MVKRTSLLLAAALTLAACAAGDDVTGPRAQTASNGTSLDAVRTNWPSADDPGNPYYARIEPVPPHLYEASGYAVIVFYRDPGCVRADFNLLDFFDPPAAFGCASHVSGASIWAVGPGIGAPKVVGMKGDGAVPVWFVPAATAEAAVADGELTIGELAGLPGLIEGTATTFRETLMPHALPPFLGGGGHRSPKITITARGTLEDGRSFQYQLHREDYGEPEAIRLDIR